MIGTDLKIVTVSLKEFTSTLYTIRYGSGPLSVRSIFRPVHGLNPCWIKDAEMPDPELWPLCLGYPFMPCLGLKDPINQSH